MPLLLLHRAFLKEDYTVGKLYWFPYVSIDFTHTSSQSDNISLLKEVLLNEGYLKDVSIESSVDFSKYATQLNNYLVCNTMEDKVRYKVIKGIPVECPLDNFMSSSDVRSVKVPGKTAIPYGHYTVNPHNYSPRFSGMPFYQKYSEGNVPLIQNVPGFTSILFHVGRLPQHTEGCILLGLNTQVGQVLQSKECFIQFYKLIAHLDEVSLLIL